MLRLFVTDLFTNWIQSLHISMVGLKEFTEGNRREKNKMFYFIRKKQYNLTCAVWPQYTLRFFIVRKHYQQRAPVPTIVRQTLRRCDLEQQVGTSGGWKKLIVWWNSVTTCPVLYLASPILLACIATRYGLDGPGIESRWGAIFSAPGPDRPWGPPSLLYNGYRVSFLGVKRPGRGVDHPSHLAPRLKKE